MEVSVVRPTKLVILPTGGMTHHTPSDAGMKRILRAVEIATECACPILIVGGARTDGLTEAEVYAAEIVRMNSGLRVETSAEDVFTALDLQSALPKLEGMLPSRNSFIAVTSNLMHAWRSAMTLWWLGYPNAEPEDSGEPITREQAFGEWILCQATLLDPSFRVWKLLLLLAGASKRRRSGAYDSL